MKTALTILLLMAYTIIFAQKEKKYPSKTDRKNFYTILSQKYSPEDIQGVFKSDSNNEFDQWVDGNTESDLIDDYPTVIHELLHGLCNTVKDGQNYYLNKDIIIYVPYTKVYKSTELNSIFRKGQQDSIVRYGIYVGGRSDLFGKPTTINTSSATQASSIKKGIYGLMEEYQAYYFGNRASFYLYDYFLNKFGKNDEDAWYDYKHMIYEDAIAYYEFNIFMSQYLLYAKTKHPDIYEGILNNKPMRVVYTLVTERFEMLLKDIEKKTEEINKHVVPNIMETMDFSGSEEDIYQFVKITGLPLERVYEETTEVVNGKTITKRKIKDTDTYKMLKNEYQKYVGEIKKQSGSPLMLYYGAPDRQMKYLKTQLTPEMQTELKKFRINGVTDQNYKDYLK